MFGDPKYHFKRVEGAIIGFAVADALGVPVEFLSRSGRFLPEHGRAPGSH